MFRGRIWPLFGFDWHNEQFEEDCGALRDVVKNINSVLRPKFGVWCGRQPLYPRRSASDDDCYSTMRALSCMLSCNRCLCERCEWSSPAKWNWCWYFSCCTALYTGL